MKRALLPVLIAAVATAYVASPALAGADRVRSEGALTSYSSAIPQGATARVQAVYTGSGSSVVTLHVWGLAPNTAYGAHAHQNACGSTGAAAGPHFQNVVDPVQPSTNPAYANADNEIWLDFTTDENGNAAAQTAVQWQFAADRRAHSVIIHQEPTHVGPPNPGSAGPRLACLTVNF